MGCATDQTLSAKETLSIFWLLSSPGAYRRLHVSVGDSSVTRAQVLKSLFRDLPLSSQHRKTELHLSVAVSLGIEFPDFSVWRSYHGLDPRSGQLWHLPPR